MIELCSYTAPPTMAGSKLQPSEPKRNQVSWESVVSYRPYTQNSTRQQQLITPSGLQTPWPCLICYLTCSSGHPFVFGLGAWPWPDILSQSYALHRNYSNIPKKFDHSCLALQLCFNQRSSIKYLCIEYMENFYNGIRSKVVPHKTRPLD